MRILKLHIGLVRYIKSELPKQKGFRQVVKFFLNLSKAYYIAMLNEYKYLLKQLDPEYKKQRTQIKKYNQYKKDLTNAYKLLQFMIKQGTTRDERKQIKKDFVDFGKISEKTEKIIMQQIYGGK
jgi:hypothetical protein